MTSYGFGSSTLFNPEASPISGMSPKGTVPLYPSAKLVLMPSSPGVTAIIIRSAFLTLTVLIARSRGWSLGFPLSAGDSVLFAAMMSPQVPHEGLAIKALLRRLMGHVS